MNSEIKVGKPDNTELEKSKAHIIVEIIEYIPNAIVSKTIIKKTTGKTVLLTFIDNSDLL